VEITEEHLQRVFDEMEEFAIKNGRNGVEYEATVSTAWIMRSKLLAIIRARSEEDLTLMKRIGKDLAGLLEGCNGDITSHMFTCGHNLIPGVIYKVADSLGTYAEWKNDTEGLCIECWSVEKKRYENIKC
jgi:hypothetical protein